MRGKCPAAARLRDRAKHFALISQRAGPLTASVYALRAAFGGCAPTRACGRSPSGEAQRVEKPPSAREVPRRGGGREPCHSPKYFGQPYSSLPHRLRAEPPPRRGGQGVSTPSRLRRLRSDTRLRAQPLGGSPGCRKTLVGASIARPCPFALQEAFPENALLRQVDGRPMVAPTHAKKQECNFLTV